MFLHHLNWTPRIARLNILKVKLWQRKIQKTFTKHAYLFFTKALTTKICSETDWFMLAPYWTDTFAIRWVTTSRKGFACKKGCSESWCLVRSKESNLFNESFQQIRSDSVKNLTLSLDSVNEQTPINSMNREYSTLARYSFCFYHVLLSQTL